MVLFTGPESIEYVQRSTPSCLAVQVDHFHSTRICNRMRFDGHLRWALELDEIRPASALLAQVGELSLENEKGRCKNYFAREGQHLGRICFTIFVVGPVQSWDEA